MHFESPFQFLLWPRRYLFPFTTATDQSCLSLADFHFVRMKLLPPGSFHIPGMLALPTLPEQGIIADYSHKVVIFLPLKHSSKLLKVSSFSFLYHKKKS